jgi:hypothetical protein
MCRVAHAFQRSPQRSARRHSIALHLTPRTSKSDLKMDAVVLNCVTQFLPMSKCLRKTRCITVAELLFLKNVSTANARCSSDQRCMMTKGFRSFYPAMCVSPCHLQRCRDGAKCKSSNCFCPTLYIRSTK